VNRKTLALLVVAIIGALHGLSEMRAQFAWAKPRAAHIANVDRFYQRHVPEGNLFVKFVGLDGARDGVFIYEQYVRATYALHPRRVYISPIPDQLPHASSIVAANVMPDDEWLRQRGVQTVVTFDATQGAPQVDFRRLAP
jgi:hypothetical protein